MKKFLIRAGLVLTAIVFGYLFVSAPLTFYKTGLTKELFAFQYPNPSYQDNKIWQDKVMQWRMSNYLTAPDINDFFFPYTNFHVVTVNKYSIIPSDDLGLEFRKFVKETLPQVSVYEKYKSEAKSKKLEETIESNKGS